jgi:hypothetical protein
MENTTIRLPKTEPGSQAFLELVRRHHVRSAPRHGEILYEVPTTALELLDTLRLPYEIVAGALVATQKTDKP